MKENCVEVRVLDARKDEQVLSEAEHKLRSEARKEGLETVSKMDIGFQVRDPTEIVSDLQDVREYLDRCRGNNEAKIALYISPEGENSTREIVEEIDVHIEFDYKALIQSYEALRDLDVMNAGFNLTGYGEDVHQALETSQPMMTYIIGKPGEEVHVTVSERNEGTIETIGGRERDFMEIYERLNHKGLAYQGEVLQGDKKGEWMAAESGSQDLEGYR